MKITRAKKDIIRQYYIDGHRDTKYLARKLGLQEATVIIHLQKFRQIEQLHPDKLQDFDFFIGTTSRAYKYCSISFAVLSAPNHYSLVCP